MPEIFPTMEQVDKANREQIAIWYWLLPKSVIASDRKIMERIADRFMNMGGMTPGLRQKIGFPQNFLRRQT